MDTDEINRQIHEFLGLGCWHRIVSKEFCDPEGHPYTMLTCQDCGIHTHTNPPNYTESLDAVRVAEEKVIEMVGHYEYGKALEKIIRPLGLRATRITEIATADAKTRCLAILKAGRVE